MLFLLLTACIPEPDLQPRWQATHEICGFEIGALDAEPNEACTQAILDDFGADEPVEDLLSAALALHTVDLGTLDTLEGPAELLADLAATSRISARDEVGALLYDYVTARVFHTTAGGAPDTAWAGLDVATGTLHLVDLPPGIDGAAILVHEARHLEGPAHVACEGEEICDDDDSGSWSYQLAVHQAARDATSDPLVVQTQQAWMDMASALIR